MGAGLLRRHEQALFDFNQALLQDATALTQFSQTIILMPQARGDLLLKRKSSF